MTKIDYYGSEANLLSVLLSSNRRRTKKDASRNVTDFEFDFYCFLRYFHSSIVVLTLNSRISMAVLKPHS